MLAVLGGSGSKFRKIIANGVLAVGSLAIASPALASGAIAYADSGQFSGLVNANGIYFNTYGPDPDVGAGVLSMTHTRLYFNRSANYYNLVGFMTEGSRGNRRLVYQTSDRYGVFTNFVPNATYSPYSSSGARNSVQAGMWQSSGNSWHFNWWGPDGLNVGLDAYNQDAGTGPNEAHLGAEGWGGCPNAYPANYAWSWLYRHRNNGAWYYMPAGRNATWGNLPTWSLFGSIANGGNISFGTTSCP